MQKTPEFLYLKLIILGNPSVGKTNLLLRHTQSKHLPTKPTILTDFFSKTYKIKNQPLKIQFWDTAGQELFKSISKNFYKNTNGIILVYDITNRRSFEDLENWKKEIFQNLEKIPILLIGNKCDLEEERVVSVEEGVFFAKKNGFFFFEMSAKNGDFVDLGFECVFEGIFRRDDSC